MKINGILDRITEHRGQDIKGEGSHNRQRLENRAAGRRFAGKESIGVLSGVPPTQGQRGRGTLERKDHLSSDRGLESRSLEKSVNADRLCRPVP